MNRLSKFTITLLGLFSLVGLWAGYKAYLDRPAIVQKHIANSNAIGIQLILAVLLVVTAGSYLVWRSKNRTNRRIITAPFSSVAAERFKYTIFLKNGVSPLNLLRIPGALFLGILFVYNFPRATFQVFYGLDPNATINAWGGPSHWGASLAHWLDCIILIVIEAALLNLVMVRHRSK